MKTVGREPDGFVLLLLKSGFIKTANGANPIVGNVLELCSGGNSAVGVADFGIINVSALSVMKTSDYLKYLFSRPSKAFP